MTSTLRNAEPASRAVLLRAPSASQAPFAPRRRGPALATRAALVLTLLTGGAPWATAHALVTVRVSYAPPAQAPGPADPAYARQRAAALDELARHLERRAPRHVAAGSTLSVTFTVIELAGRYEWWHAPQAQGVRIVRDVYASRLAFEFTLADATGRQLTLGRRDLTEPAVRPRESALDDPLRGEKALLDDWLAREFAPAGAAPSR